MVVTNRKGEHQTRSVTSDLNVRSDDNDEMVIEGYFAVFNKRTELFPGAFEKIDSEAFNSTLGNDVRALINHDTTMVLGRNKSNTLELKTDSHGLWGKVRINEHDADAVNMYQRVKRGDIDGCSFGFNIINEETDFRDDGSIEWTLKEIDLHEVSVCTFPAYDETGIQARHNEIKQHEKRKFEQRKNQLRERLKNAIKATNDSKED